MAEFIITAERLPDWDDAQVRRRLGRAYALILSYGGKGQIGRENGTADQGEFGDPGPVGGGRPPSDEAGGADVL